MSFKPSEGPRFWSSEGEAAGSQGLGGHLHCNEWSPKLGLCLLLLNRNMETEFWVKEKKTALLLCQAKGAPAGSCLKDCAPLERGLEVVLYKVWGVENRAVDKHQGRGKLPCFSKLVFRSSRHGTAETNPASIHEVVGSVPGLAQWVKDPALP